MFLLWKETPFLGRGLKLVFLKWNKFFSILICFYVRCSALTSNEITFLSFYHGGNDLSFGSNVDFFGVGGPPGRGGGWEEFAPLALAPPLLSLHLHMWEREERESLNKYNRAKTIFKSREYNKDIHNYSKHDSRDIINDKAVLQLWRECVDWHDLSSLNFQKINKYYIFFFIGRFIDSVGGGGGV